VSAIADPAEVEVTEFRQLGGTVVNLLSQDLVKALADAGLVVVAQAPPPTIRSAKPMWMSPSSLDLSRRACVLTRARRSSSTATNQERMKLGSKKPGDMAGEEGGVGLEALEG
jgi:hypothetical protein